MNNKDQNITYFAYCRKSSEDSQRQVASISDQTTAVNKIVTSEGLNLSNIFTEERSSKEPGRPIFNEMLNRIEKGEANGIVCYDVDRLYRNPVDEGRLRWMLQKGVIRVIRTPYRQFNPDDAGLLMGVEGGRATDYIIRLSRNVRRGLMGKVRKGWRPTTPALGYVNIVENGEKKTGVDPQKFDQVRQMWDMFLSGTYSISKILKIATDTWGMRTNLKRKLGGKALSLSHMYRIFNDPFYYGYFNWIDPDTGEVGFYKGNHPVTITEAEFTRAQVLLGKKGKQQPKTREFAFTGLMKCGECASAITAEEKNQIICTYCKHKFTYEKKTDCPKCRTDISKMINPTILKYIYYRCTKKANKRCAQKYLRLEELEGQFNETLDSLKIDEDYLKLALEYLDLKRTDLVHIEQKERLSLQDAYNNCQTRLNNLHREYTSVQNMRHELYSPEEFRSLKTEIIQERDKLEQELKKSKESNDKSLELTERTFNFCTYAKAHFNTNDLQKKRAIFSTIGSNITLKDKKLFIDRLHPFLLIENELKAQRQLQVRLEPVKGITVKEKEVALTTSLPNVSAR